MEKQDKPGCGLCNLYKLLTPQASLHMLAGIIQKGLELKKTGTQKEALELK